MEQRIIKEFHEFPPGLPGLQFYVVYQQGSWFLAQLPLATLPGQVHRESCSTAPVPPGSSSSSPRDLFRASLGTSGWAPKGPGVCPTFLLFLQMLLLWALIWWSVLRPWLQRKGHNLRWQLLPRVKGLSTTHHTALMDPGVPHLGSATLPFPSSAHHVTCTDKFGLFIACVPSSIPVSACSSRLAIQGQFSRNNI